MQQIESTSDTSLLSLFHSLVADFKLLATQQFQLAMHEMQGEVSRLVRIAVAVGGLLLLGLVSVVLLAFTLIATLHEVLELPLWASAAIITGLVVLGLGGLGLYLKLQLSHVRLYPVRTLFTLKEDALWIKEQIASRKM